MHRKAQNFVEITMLAALVAILSFSVWAIYNNQKLHIANSSKPTINQQSVNLKSISTNSAQWNDKVPYKSVETAGALSIIGMTQGDFNASMSNITYKQLSNALTDKAGTDKDLLALALELGNELNVKNPELKIPSPAVSQEDINVDTLSILAKMLNEASNVPEANRTATESAYIKRITTLLKEANATLPGTK